MGWLPFDDEGDLYSDGALDFVEDQMRALCAKHPDGPPSMAALLDAALWVLNRRGQEWVEPWPGMLGRLSARSESGADVVTSTGVRPDLWTGAALEHLLHGLSEEYQEKRGRKPRLPELLFYIDASYYPAWAGGEDALRSRVQFELSSGQVQAEDPGEAGSVDAGRWWPDQTGALVLGEVLAEVLREQAERVEAPSIHALIAAAFDLLTNDSDGLFAHAGTLHDGTLELRRGETSLVSIASLSEDDWETIGPVLGPLARAFLRTSQTYLAELGRKPLLVEMAGCLAYALNEGAVQGLVSDPPKPPVRLVWSPK